MNIDIFQFAMLVYQKVSITIIKYYDLYTVYIYIITIYLNDIYWNISKQNSEQYPMEHH
jgi:hypothetical protein